MVAEPPACFHLLLTVFDRLIRTIKIGMGDDPGSNRARGFPAWRYLTPRSRHTINRADVEKISLSCWAGTVVMQF
jgi:hypothetical protein